jgi:PhoH-like ATPase
VTEIRTYVIDTSVLLSDPWACSRFAEHEVVVPLVVISELEAKRHHHELGWFARQALRLFDDLRLEHGRLDQPIPVGAQGGTSSSTTPTPPCCPPDSAPIATIPGS